MEQEFDKLDNALKKMEHSVEKLDKICTDRFDHRIERFEKMRREWNFERGTDDGYFIAMGLYIIAMLYILIFVL